MSTQSRMAATVLALMSVMSCGGGGSKVLVDTTIPVIANFSATPSTVKAGEAVQLLGSFGDASGMVSPGQLYLASGAPLTVRPTVSTTYQLEVTNQLGKKARASTSVQVKPSATITPSLARPPYVTSQENFWASVPDQGSSSTYAWSATGATITLGQGSSNVIVHAGSPGAISLSCQVRNSAGETDSSTVNLTSVAAPDATLVMDWAKAPYATIGVDGYTVRVPSNPGSAKWTYGSGLELTAITPSQLTFRPRPYYGMDQTVTCEVTNAADAQATGSVVVKVVNPPAISAFGISKPVLTRGDHAQLRFTFTGGDGVIQPDGTPLSTDPYSHQGTLDVAPNADRSYRLVVTNLAGDSVEAHAQVRLVAPPVLTSFTSSGSYASAEAGVQMTAVFQDGHATLDPGGLPMQSGVPVTVKPGIPTRYRLSVANEAGTVLQDRQVIIPSGGLAESLYSSYAVSSAGQLLGWGSNTRGQLGLDHHLSQSQPAEVPGMTDVRLVEAGEGTWNDSEAPGFMVALKRDGTVWACGSNEHGQLGTGARLDSSSPTQIPGLSDIVLVACGQEHTLALKSDGTVWAWGANPHGELGLGGTEDILSPTQLPNLPPMVLVGAHAKISAALAADGTIWTWGSGNPPAILPGRMDPLAIHKGGLWMDGKWIYFLTDSYYNASLDGSGAIGYGGDGSLLMADGRILLRQVYGTSVTLPLDGGTGAIRWSGRSLLKADGTLHAWGSNTWGQAGDVQPLLQSSPVKVVGLGAVTDMAMGGSMGAARKQDGSLWAWGRLNFRNLQVPGDPTPIPLATALPLPAPAPIALQSGPMAISTADLWIGDPAMGPALWSLFQASAWLEPAGLQKLAGGDDHFLGLRADGTLWALGSCNQGQLGLGASFAIYTQVGSWTKTDSSGLVAIAAGSAHSLALQADGRLLGFGRNLENQAGPMADVNLWVPTPIPGLGSVTAIAAGANRSLAVKADGTVWQWGEGIGGTPVQVPGLSDVTALSAGSSHVLALKSDGTVWTWGLNSFGQLGTGNTVDAPSPVQVPGLTHVLAIQAKARHSAARDASGNLWVWGADAPWGQLGQGRLLWTPTPRPLPGASPLW